MTKKTEKVIKVGVTRAAQLYDREESVIRKRCKLGRLVARQAFPGAEWDIYIPEEEYQELLRIAELRKN